MRRYFLLDTRAFMALVGVSFLTGFLIGHVLSAWIMSLRGIG